MEKGDTETNYISKQFDKIIRFNQRHGILSIIIAHPTKIRKNLKTGLFEVPNLYDISGSSNWFNKPDIGITFYRNYETKLSEIHVQKMKYNHLGSQGMVEVRYNINNSRFNNLYGEWDNSNWLLPNEPQAVMNFTESVREQEQPVNQQLFMSNIRENNYSPVSNDADAPF
jgi:twinkle protein